MVSPLLRDQANFVGTQINRRENKVAVWNREKYNPKRRVLRIDVKLIEVTESRSF